MKVTIPRPKLYEAPEIYDAPFSWDPAIETEFYGKLLRKSARKTRSRLIVEFGCGTGRILRILSVLGFRCFGIDVSPSMSRYAYGRGSRGSIDIVVAEMTRVPARAETFAAAICTLSTINYLPVKDFSLHLREVNRVLVQHGVYIIDFLLGVPRKKRESWEIDRNGKGYRVSWGVKKASPRADRFEERIDIRSGSALLVWSKGFTSVIRRKALNVAVRGAGFKVKSWFKPFTERPLDSPPTTGRVVTVLEKQNTPDRTDSV